MIFFFQSFPGPSLESEDFNIPPITPPSLPDHSLVHLNEIESGYHSLCHPMNHNGLLPFHPQNMDLPEITVSNMLGQDGALLSNSLSVVSIFSLPLLLSKLWNRGSADLLEVLCGASSCTTQVTERPGLTLGCASRSLHQTLPPPQAGGVWQPPWGELLLLYTDVNNDKRRLRAWSRVWIQMAVVLCLSDEALSILICMCWEMYKNLISPFLFTARLENSKCCFWFQAKSL